MEDARTSVSDQSTRHFLDLHVADQAFDLEAIAYEVDRKRKRLQSQANLARVAMMMDEWTRVENQAYAVAMDRQNQLLSSSRLREAELLSANNQLAGIILELEHYLDVIRPNRVRYHSIRQTDSGVLVPVTHILPEVIDLTSDSDIEPESELMTQLMDF